MSRHISAVRCPFPGAKTGDPLFIFGAVAVGMFGMPLLGRSMALAHYIGALVVGIIFRFYGMADRGVTPERARQGNILGRALNALYKAREEDGRPIGQIIGDAVNDSIKTLFMICGFIMLFATMVKIVDVVGLYKLIALPLDGLFRLLGIAPTLVKSVVTGLFEIDLGTVAASQAAAPLIQQVAIASAIIAWSGFSVHGQVASVLTGTDIRMRPYVYARFLHAIIAYLVTLLLLRSATPAMWNVANSIPVIGALPTSLSQPGFWATFSRSLSWSAGLPLALAAIGTMAAAVTGGFKWVAFHTHR